ncbi:hypothetical protein BM221_008547 [Beauveria bassiana]|uniref:Uncharacterized protein n=1 Tax=Beauveria bassiana TaxID=176275 RepID=A0A2N6ND45_BEABA|nr:hypothetical protein BM221_008547 [Beauveria bassiana]
MANYLDPDLPETVAQLVTPHGPHVLSNLDTLGSSASKWGAGEVKAFRVLKNKAAWQTSFLLPLRDLHEHSCPICHPESSTPYEVNPAMIEHLLTPVSRLRTASESFLCGLPTGSFHLALARLIRCDVRDPVRNHNTRERAGDRPVAQYPDFVPSSMIPFPESSSPARRSSSEYSGSHASIPLDDDQNEFRARRPESLVANLVKELFHLSLYSVLKQCHPKEEFCFRPESHSSWALIAATGVVGADDGGLCKKRLQSGSWTTLNPSLMLGESKGPACSVYSYICNGTFIRFLHFDFGSRYEEYLDAPTENEQLDIVQDYPEDTCVRVSSTKWLDLEEPKDVIHSICHILTRVMMEGHESEESEDQPENDHEAGYQSDVMQE